MIRGYLKAAGKSVVAEGRADRAEFWSFTVINIAVISCLAIIDQHSAGASAEAGVGLASAIAFLIVCVPQTAVMIRRLHDTGRAAWWVFLGIVPLLGMFLLLGMAALEGDRGTNRYGPDPREFSSGASAAEDRPC